MPASAFLLLANDLPSSSRPQSPFQEDLSLLEFWPDGDGDDGEDDDTDIDDPVDDVVTEISNQLTTITNITPEMAQAVQAAIGHNAAVTVGTTTAVALGNTTVTNETDTSFSFQGMVALTDSLTGAVMSVTATQPGSIGTVSTTVDSQGQPDGISIK